MAIRKPREAASNNDAPELPKGWRRVRFGDVVRNVDVSERNPLEKGIERFVGLEHIDPESLHIKRWGLIEGGTSFTRKFIKGQVLFGKRRAYQRKVAVAEFDGICSGDILVFEPKDDQLLSELLPFIVQTDGFFEHALGTSAGSLSPRTRWKDLAEYELALPPKDEQRRIADILWAIENTLRLYERIRSELKSVKEAYLQRIFFGKPEAEMGRGRSLAALTLKEICKKITDGEHISPKTTRVGMYLLSAKDIQAEYISFEDPKYVNEEDFLRFRKRCDPRADDILIVSRGATIGRCHLIKPGTPDFALMGSVILVRPEQSMVHPLYLLSYLRHSAAQMNMLAGAGATAQPAIYLKYIKELVVPILPMDVQSDIVSAIERLDDGMRVIEKHISELIKLRSKLLISSLYH